MLTNCDWCGRRMNGGRFCSTRCATEYNKNKDDIPKSTPTPLWIRVGIFVIFFCFVGIKGQIAGYTGLLLLKYGFHLQVFFLLLLLVISITGFINVCIKYPYIKQKLLIINLSLIAVVSLLICSGGPKGIRYSDLLLSGLMSLCVCFPTTYAYIKITKTK